jgi:hypothetical protein
MDLHPRQENFFLMVECRNAACQISPMKPPVNPTSTSRVMRMKNHPTRLLGLRSIAASLISAACCLLAGCGVIDPRYDALAAKAETHPPRNAIVGMWNEKINETFLDSAHSSHSILFNSDGTGVSRAVSTIYSKWDLTADPPAPQQWGFTWKQAGGGGWNVVENGASYPRWRIMISGSNLLLSNCDSAGVCSGGSVYERVQ